MPSNEDLNVVTVYRGVHIFCRRVWAVGHSDHHQLLQPSVGLGFPIRGSCPPILYS